jgi:hypothetical protein
MVHAKKSHLKGFSVDPLRIERTHLPDVSRCTQGHNTPGASLTLPYHGGLGVFLLGDIRDQSSGNINGSTWSSIPYEMNRSFWIISPASIPHPECYQQCSILSSIMYLLSFIIFPPRLISASQFTSYYSIFSRTGRA